MSIRTPNRAVLAATWKSLGGHEESSGVLTEFTNVELTLGCFILVIVFLCKLPNCVNGYVTLT
ncbi:hypothetical protein DVH24_028780 [Malus domestica]|uniref:Uncharacterized protein n=1 Tax=Malus domestica TaxID=3750 RepID=A0A498IVQ0_MALDO|nr:hypothetical protein DVH24_028780 [Malus domestica]